MDYKVFTPAGDGGQADQSELEVQLVAVRKEVADTYAAILKKCKIRADIIEAAPISIYNAYAGSLKRDPEEVTALISIGASGTDIVVEQNGSMQFMRNAPEAGSSLTTALAKNLEIPFDKAEELKTKPAPDYSQEEGEGGSITADKVSAILEKGFERIATEIRRSFDFYVSQSDAMPVTRVFLSGGSSKMEGVTDFLSERLGVPVELFGRE